ncbi:hypothetical protein FGB62_173g03 [Gracilaria domingensis]|nr:hypothetical protein FGB62_173g03 [Gracilaria domingensis]
MATPSTPPSNIIDSNPDFHVVGPGTQAEKDIVYDMYQGMKLRTKRKFRVQAASTLSSVTLSDFRKLENELDLLVARIPVKQEKQEKQDNNEDNEDHHIKEVNRMGKVLRSLVTRYVDIKQLLDHQQIKVRQLQQNRSFMGPPPTIVKSRATPQSMTTKKMSAQAQQCVACNMGICYDHAK